MSLMSREQLLAKQPPKVEKIDLGEDQFIFVREMSAHDRDAFERSLIKPIKDEKGEVNFTRAMEDFRAKLAVLTVCDEEGKNILDPDDYVQLSMNMGSARMEKIVEGAQKLNAITKADKEALVKNSERAQGGSSVSG
jgi:hypothetical protein